MHAVFFVGSISAEWNRNNRNLRVHVVEAHADNLIVKESQRTNVTVFPMAFGAHQLGKVLCKIRRSVRKLHAHQLRRLKESSEMIHWTENEQLFFLIIPVGAKPSKHRGSVIQRVCKDADLRLGIRDDAAAKECIFG